MNAADTFSASYAEARTKFHHAVINEGGAVVASFAHPKTGPDGKELATDAAWFGARDAERVIVLISGTHGVEGFAGSGAQIDLIRRGEPRNLNRTTAALFVHALNPYGFAWRRRTTHENIDLNRNWIDFDKARPFNQHYEALHALLCPSDWNEQTIRDGEEAMAAYAAEHGADALRHALGAGQYSHPQGLYYGGAGHSWSRQTMTTIVHDLLGQAEVVAVIDYHTGLGPRGLAELISTAPRESDSFRTARHWYGGAITSTTDGSSSGAKLSGDGLNGVAALLNGRLTTSLALEIGTIARPEVLRALRADAWLHAHGDPSSPLGVRIQESMQAAYYCDDPLWRGMVMGQSLSVWRETLAGMEPARAAAN